MKKNYPPIIQALTEPSVYNHPVDTIEIIETHISYVLLTGKFVYKIKKPVDLGFVNFTTLQKRKFFCQEEIRLNKRTAPNLYLNTVAIGGTAHAPILGDRTKAIEYAVKMRQFPQSQQLDRLLHRQELPINYVENLATDVANFHQSISVAGPTSSFSDLDKIQQRTLQNFQQLEACRKQLDSLGKSLDALEHWTKQKFSKLTPLVKKRKSDKIRECHGDMHLANLALIDNRIVPFDCLEFNPDLRWIDVISDISFLTMDLEYHNKYPLSNYFINRYLQVTGDYSGLGLLLFYKVYRALVRAKVACIRLNQQTDKQDRNDSQNELEKHISLACRYIGSTSQNVIIIMHGTSGSGKSYIARKFAGESGAICLRSDLERKRLHHLSETDRSNNILMNDLYSASNSKKTYAHLLETSAEVLEAGYSVIVDAAFLSAWQREMFYDFSRDTGVAYYVFNIRAPRETLEARILERGNIGTDPSDANVEVLHYQLKNSDPLSAKEKPYAIDIESTIELDIKHLIEQTNIR
ncbi:AAA family ATPase [Pseudomonadota bacterium]